ncbi:MAG: hypothetical protein KZQ93_06210 [Candidatus Thiodiazotropha sp. (ex Monitilora ramsayi)]|nr:hypothetical protein [Candidatus Thiodiazotropha sp. (ex Monitilora ramsayi)]
MNEQPVFNLDGYLHSLRRLSGNKCDYWAEVFEITGDIKFSFRERANVLEVNILDFIPVGYRELEAFFETEFRSSLKSQEGDLIKLFVWDVVEYIQMTFRDVDPEVDPIHEKQSFIARAQSKFHGNYSYVVVPVKTKAIAVGVAARA